MHTSTSLGRPRYASHSGVMAACSRYSLRERPSEREACARARRRELRTERGGSIQRQGTPLLPVASASLHGFRERGYGLRLGQRQAHHHVATSARAGSQTACVIEAATVRTEDRIPCRPFRLSVDLVGAVRWVRWYKLRARCGDFSEALVADDARTLAIEQPGLPRRL